MHIARGSFWHRKRRCADFLVAELGVHGEIIGSNIHDFNVERFAAVLQRQIANGGHQSATDAAAARFGTNCKWAEMEAPNNGAVRMWILGELVANAAQNRTVWLIAVCERFVMKNVGLHVFNMDEAQSFLE